MPRKNVPDFDLSTKKIAVPENCDLAGAPDSYNLSVLT